MKNYIVTVNGVSYEVSVEEVGEGQGSSACSRSSESRSCKGSSPC